MEKAFLESYGGQTTAELVAMSNEYRVDSLVLAFEQALQSKSENELSEPERYILAIEAMEREVNNGGWDQFFLNTENEFDSILPRALDAIECPNTARISRDAIQAWQEGGENSSFDEFDSAYYATGESIENKLFAYINANADSINLNEGN